MAKTSWNKTSSAVAESSAPGLQVVRSQGRPKDWAKLTAGFLYPAALVTACSLWLFALRAPLWLDETLSYWQVSGGFAKVWTRSMLMPSSIGYLYTLWLVKSVFGTSEMALKIPSLLALLIALFFLFRTAQEMFGREAAFLTGIFFCLEGNVVFAATDARPYAFALLATTVAAYAFVRWMITREIRLAILFGVAAASVLYFHYLFASVLPAFVIYYLIVRWRSVKSDLRQIIAGASVFFLASLPLGYRVLSLYHTRQAHIMREVRHPILTVLNVLVPQQTLIGFIAVVFLAALVRKIALPKREETPNILLALLLGLIPAGILIAISSITSAHLLVPRYLTVAAPGSAMIWAQLTKRLDSRGLRLLFCCGLAAFTFFEFYTSTGSRQHELNFKQAHELVNSIAGPEQLPVLECSGFIESNYEPVPLERAGENALLSQIDYYPIQAPVTLLPLTFNEASIQAVSKVVQRAAQRQEKFLTVGTADCLSTMSWLAGATRNQYAPRILADFGDEIVVAEFDPLKRSW